MGIGSFVHFGIEDLSHGRRANRKEAGESHREKCNAKLQVLLAGFRFLD